MIKLSNKAFTLVELLGVIVLLTLITLIVLPKITEAVKNKQNDVDKVNKKIIYAAVELYIKDTINLEELEIGDKYCIELEELENKNYLKEIKDVYKNESLSNKAILAHYNNGFNYTLYDSLSLCETQLSN